jgi:hypothetical protein
MHKKLYIIGPRLPAANGNGIISLAGLVKSSASTQIGDIFTNLHFETNVTTFFTS